MFNLDVNHLMLWSCRLSSVDQGILPPPGHASHERVLAMLARQDALRADYQASLHQETGCKSAFYFERERLLAI